jgi:hypothetical protein
MMSRKERIDNGWLERLDESLAEDLLTDAYRAEEIIENVRALGGDPEKIGERGRAIGAEVLARGRVRKSTLGAPARREVSRIEMISDAPEKHGQLRHQLLASPFGGVAVSHQDQNPSEEFMNKNFQFKQLLRAYRSGIIDDHTFEMEMSNLETGASNGNNLGFRAFGKSYASEREAVIKFLEAVAPAETAGGQAIREWLQFCKLDCIKGGLKMVAERESYHGRAFAQRLVELGGTVPQSVSPEIRESIDYLRDANMSDLEKLHKAATRYPNPEETIRPLFEFADLLKEDQQTKEMVKLFAQDELSTLKWQNSLCATLTEMKKNGQLAAAA